MNIKKLSLLLLIVFPSGCTVTFLSIKDSPSAKIHTIRESRDTVNILNANTSIVREYGFSINDTIKTKKPSTK